MTACVFDESALFSSAKKIERMHQDNVEPSRCLGRNSNDATCLPSFKWAMTYQRRPPSSLTNTTLHNIRKPSSSSYIHFTLTPRHATKTDGIVHHKVAPCSAALFAVAAPSSWTRQAPRTQVMGPRCLKSKRRVRSSEGEGSP